MSINPYQAHPRHITAPNTYDYNGALKIEPVNLKPMEKNFEYISKQDTDVLVASSALVIGSAGLCATVVVAVDFFRKMMGYS